MHNTTFDDYMLRAVLASVNAARKTCGSQQMHLAGYCIGGTIVTALMAWVNRSPGPDAPAAYATFLTALVNYSVPGDIETLIDEHSLHTIDDLMTHHGYLDGRDMAMSFRTLRSNSLIWHYWAHNYLLGESLPAFDVLYWNSDAPAAALRYAFVLSARALSAQPASAKRRSHLGRGSNRSLAHQSAALRHRDRTGSHRTVAIEL
jgi:polyhydroxyalkanoate synthase